MATERDHGVGNTHRVRTTHLGEIGSAPRQRKGSLGSDPDCSGLAARMADTDPECQSEDEHCNAHDEGIWNAAKALVDVLPEEECQQLATLPMRMGALELRSAVWRAPAAYWASWADALHMISDWTPDVANDLVRKLGEEEPQDGCLGELCAAANELDHKGFWWIPSCTGQSCTRAGALREQRLVNQASGHTCCPTVPTCALTPVARLELRSPTLRLQQSAQFLHTSSRCYCPASAASDGGRCNGCHEPLDTLG